MQIKITISNNAPLYPQRIQRPPFCQNFNMFSCFSHDETVLLVETKDKLNIRGETNLNVSHRQVRCVTKNKQTGEQYCNIAHLHEDLQMFPKHCRVLSICKMNDFRMCICNGQTKVCFTPIETGFCVTLHMRFMFMKYFFSYTWRQ